MFKFVYDHTDYHLLMEDYARALEVPFINNTIIYPKDIAGGQVNLIELSNGLQAISGEYTLNQDICLQRAKDKNEFYTLRFDEITIAGNLVMRIDGESVSETAHTRSAVVLSSSLFDFIVSGKRGSTVKNIVVLITKEWMCKYLGIADTDQVLLKYISLKTACLNMEPLDATYRQWVDEVLQADKSLPLSKAMVQNRIMLLIERFFTRLYEKINLMDKGNEVMLCREDIYRIMDVESLLINEGTIIAPTIDELAKTANMSPSKLKKNFKQVYGSPIYEYYQKNRMQRAKNMLLTGNYSVKEVGLGLGYANLSNFTLAFKKEFQQLPSDFLRN
jgi:AraC-like DNA-binding protein